MLKQNMVLCVKEKNKNKNHMHKPKSMHILNNLISRKWDHWGRTKKLSTGIKSASTHIKFRWGSGGLSP